MKNILLLVSIFAFTGCMTALTQEAARISQVTPNEIRGCTTLGDVVGKSSYGGFFLRESGKAFAKNEAMNSAVTMGATHIVWTLTEGTMLGARAIGVAYKCSKVAGN